MEGVGGGSVDGNTESRSEVRGDLCCCSDGGETESRGIKKKKRATTSTHSYGCRDHVSEPVSGAGRGKRGQTFKRGK